MAIPAVKRWSKAGIATELLSTGTKFCFAVRYFFSFQAFFKPSS
jgi:hypothetical protein